MTVQPGARLPVLVRAGRASVAGGACLAACAEQVGRPHPENPRSRRLAHLGGLAAVSALVLYLTWRLLFTLPLGGPDRVAGLVLVLFEALPLARLVATTVALWNIDSAGPDPVTDAGPGHRVVVLITTDDEPVEVVAPTIAAACALRPTHQTWVLDDGDRPWMAELAVRYGARYVRRSAPDHAAAGALDHALTLLQAEIAAGAERLDVVAVLDGDHVPLATFLTDTLGWFDDPEIALVQAPQAYYNAGAFDDDGETGEQGLLFHVLMPGRDARGVGPFWSGSTALLRLEALAGVGGVATGTAAAHLQTSLNLLRAGWKTTYHHQVLAVGLAASTSTQYLSQRRRWGLGAMQLLVAEGCTARRGLSRRVHRAYLSATLIWLQGVGTALALGVPAVLLVSGASTTTASPLVVALAVLLMLAVRLWGAEQLYRQHLRWRTAVALRVLRVPVGLSCLRWLLTRREPRAEVATGPVAGDRARGKVPGVLWLLVGLTAGVLLHGLLGVTGLAPWRLPLAAAVASGVWLVLGLAALVLALRHVQAPAHASSRRRGYRAPVHALVNVNGQRGELVDVSVGGVALQLPRGAFSTSSRLVALHLPLAPTLELEPVRMWQSDDLDHVALRVPDGDWDTYRALSLWLFHTPPGVVDGLPPQAPAVAAMLPTNHSRRPPLVCRHG
ncbi:hypothetical protein GCM10009616_02860 [Microlunatus lacustris]